MVVPLKKQRTGKFFKPWDSPDEMNLEEVRRKDVPVVMARSARGGGAKKQHIFLLSSYYTLLHNKT